MTGLIVHEWAARSGGSERVVEQMAQAFPDSELQVLWDDTPGRFGVVTRESWLARTPLRRHKALVLPLLPMVWRAMSAPRQYDWMMVSSHLFAHHARIRGQADLAKLVYAHTPARYIWAPEHDHRGQARAVKIAAAAFKPLDRLRAQEATSIAANSSFTAARIKAAWGRDARVIYPPVDTEGIRAEADWFSRLDSDELERVESLPTEYLLGASRFVTYKRLDLVIRMAAVSKLPVVIAGAGPEEAALRRLADELDVQALFIISPSDCMLRALYQSALAYVFPAIEDFGIMPVEAMATGTPAIVASVGGSRESVEEAGGGVIIEDWSDTQMKSAVESAARLNREEVALGSTKFSNERFRRQIVHWIDEEVPR